MTFAPVHHILPLATIVRERMLPIKGTVLARIGQKVNPADIVAEAVWAREHFFLDVSRTLNLPPDEADKLIRCKPGDQLAAGAIIASGRGFLPKQVKAPREGRVVAAGGGQVLLESGESRMELRAGISGYVTQVIADRGVEIQTTGALVQGVWGNGRVDTGVMINLADKPDTLLTAGRLDVSMRGSILVIGRVKEEDALYAAAELPVRGLIVGSMPPSLITAAREVRYPIVLTEGFGMFPMNTAAYRLITTNAKREATLHAEAFDRYSGARPEIIIPLPTSTPPAVPHDVEAFAPGQTVRLRRMPAAGQIATLMGLHDGLATFPSGLRAPAGEVRLENGEQLLIPLVNLEVVG
ncbi:MAG: hypothetical protein ACM3MF_00015 [Anaerolineae bacterium]